jgi:hypothetical protein
VFNARCVWKQCGIVQSAALLEKKHMQCKHASSASSKTAHQCITLHTKGNSEHTPLQSSLVARSRQLAHVLQHRSPQA